MKKWISINSLILLVASVAMGGAAQADVVLYGIHNTSGTGGGGGTGPGTGGHTGSFFGTVDLISGVFTEIGPVGFSRVSAMDVDPTTGVIYATGNRSGFDQVQVLLTINPITGAGTEIGPPDPEEFSRYTDMSFRHSDSTLFAFNEFGTNIATIDITTGIRTDVGNVGSHGCCGEALAFDLSDVLFHADDEMLLSINQTTGAGTILVDPLDYSPIDSSIFSRTAAMDVHPLTGDMYASVLTGFGAGEDEDAPAGTLAIFDLDTGTFDYFGPSGVKLDAIAFFETAQGAAQVPEPTTLLLLGLGLAGLGFMRRWPH